MTTDLDHLIVSADNNLAASDLASVLERADDPVDLLLALVARARRTHRTDGQSGLESLVFARVIHTTASSLQRLHEQRRMDVTQLLLDWDARLLQADRQWLEPLGLAPSEAQGAADFCRRAKRAAFDNLARVIISSGIAKTPRPRVALRSGESVWGGAPARLDMGGGWTDTPPYSCEHGGCVVNVAADLDGRLPIQAYLTILPEPVIRITSIDQGTKTEITSLDELLDYREPGSDYGLAKAALALSGFSPDRAPWPDDASLERMLELFGGGIELRTLSAVPKGSGLGTSSIMGAVLLAVIARATGRDYGRQDLFNAVLQLEQLLTTGGGWQDQIGGAVGGAKIITTQPGLVPDARIDCLPPDLLDPSRNGGLTLLYYTGITRLAKDILSQVVGHYLDRDQAATATLRRIHALAPKVAEAISLKDLRALGELVAEAWELNKQLDPGSTNDEIDALFDRIRPYVYGAKLLGAGGGGFLFMVTRSQEACEKIRQTLETDPPNHRARFFSYTINNQGLTTTAYSGPRPFSYAR